MSMKILFATDGSAYAQGSAKFLTALNLSADDEIIILYATGSLIPAVSAKTLIAGVRQIMLEIGAGIIDETVSILKPCGAKINTVLADGDPAQAIADAAEKHNADLVVVGSRGMRGIKSFVVGSVARSVAAESQKPLLIVKPLQWDRKERLKILFATDGSDCSNATAHLLSSMPFSSDTGLTVLTVIPSSFADIPPRFAMEVDDRIKKELADARAAEYEDSDRIISLTLNMLSGKFAKIEEMKKVGEPSVEILEAAAAINADIVAIGSRGLRGIKGALGSVSRHVLNHAECSVLIGKT